MNEIYKKYIKHMNSELALISIMFLFFFELISDFLESIYALNLIAVELNENILAVLFLLTPIILLMPIFKKGFPDKILLLLGEIIVITRILQPFFMQPSYKMIITGIGVGCFMIFLPVYLKRLNPSEHEKYGLMLGGGLAFGLAASILFRTLGSSIDISTYSWFQWIGWILGAIAAIILVNLLNPKQIELKNTDPSSNTSSLSNNSENKRNVVHVNKWKIFGLSLGMISILVIIYFAFSSPTVISRWTEGNHIAITIILVLMITAFIFVALYKPNIITKLKLREILLWNVIFVLTLVLTILPHQIIFAFVSSHPYYAPETTIISHVLLYLMLFLTPIILIDFTLLSRELIKCKPSLRTIGGAFFLSSGFFLLMMFSQVFTIVWDYIPLIGFLFRDMFWFVFLIIGVFIALPVLLLREHTLIFKKPSIRLKTKIRIRGIIGLICVGTIVGVLILEFPIMQGEPTTSIRVLSYNIQQGIDDNANKNFDGQFEEISQLDADIIGLQESDTCRISSGNSDVVRFINNKLKLYSYFGPKTVTGTFGLALLSKYPIESAKTFYMTSIGEQTATLEAQITIKGRTYNIFVTHLGNYVSTSVDRSQIIQQEEILQRIKGLTNVILMGDFNFRPGTEQYKITTDVLYDCWSVATISTVDTVPKSWESRLPEERIDHMFVSSSLKSKVNYCIFLGGTASDHPAVLSVIQV